MKRERSLKIESCYLCGRLREEARSTALAVSRKGIAKRIGRNAKRNKLKSLILAQIER